MRRAFCRAAATAVTVFLAGCTVGPEFVSPLPQVATSRTFLDTGKPARAPLRILAGTTPAEPESEWWRVFHDPMLTRLEARVAEENLDVRTATLRLAESRAQLGTAAAAALPTVSGTASALRDLLALGAPAAGWAFGAWAIAISSTGGPMSTSSIETRSGPGRIM